MPCDGGSLHERPQPASHSTGGRHRRIQHTAREETAGPRDQVKRANFWLTWVSWSEQRDRDVDTGCCGGSVLSFFFYFYFLFGKKTDFIQCLTLETQTRNPL